MIVLSNNTHSLIKCEELPKSIITIKDLIDKFGEVVFMYRVRCTDEQAKEWGFDDIWTGVCEYKNGELISCDGDNYYLDDEVIDYKMRNDGKTIDVWINGSMMTSSEYKEYLKRHKAEINK